MKLRLKTPYKLKSPFTKCSPIKSFSVGALGTETQTISNLGEPRWFPSTRTGTQQGLPREAVVSPSLEVPKCSDALTCPSPEQPNLARPVLSRELHQRLPEGPSNLNYSVPLVMLWLHDGMRRGHESFPTPTGRKDGCKQREAQSDWAPHGLDTAESRTGSRCVLLSIYRLGRAGVNKMWLYTNACSLPITMFHMLP